MLEISLFFLEFAPLKSFVFVKMFYLSSLTLLFLLSHYVQPRIVFNVKCFVSPKNSLNFANL